MLTRYPELDDVLKLDFQPVRNNRPAALTRAQIEQFNEQGFAGPVRLFSGDDLARLQRFFRESEAERKALEDQATGFTSLHHLISGLYDVVIYPRTVARLRDLLGPNVVCHTSQYVNKPPGQTTGGSFHQDATFNALDARCVVVWVAIEDADVENGCMWFIPGSHKAGVVECDAGHFVVEPGRYGKESPCEVRAGHAVFMSDLLMHSSPPNRSKDRFRPGFTATYAPAELMPREAINRWAVLCCGADVNGLWQPHARPDGTPIF